MNTTATTTLKHRSPIHTYVKLFIVGGVGVIVGVVLAVCGVGQLSLLAGWDTTIVLYLVWVWLSVLPLTGEQARTHAVREDPGRAIADILLVIASVASLGAVLLLVLEASRASGIAKGVDVGLGLASVIVSWFLVHTTYALKYARLYYGGKKDNGVSFNEADLPVYTDFAYLAFTLGMTFQVSDTNITTKEMRAAALKHALLAYLFGTVIIATTINILASFTQAS